MKSSLKVKGELSLNLVCLVQIKTTKQIAAVVKARVVTSFSYFTYLFFFISIIKL